MLNWLGMANAVQAASGTATTSQVEYPEPPSRCLVDVRGRRHESIAFIGEKRSSVINAVKKPSSTNVNFSQFPILSVEVSVRKPAPGDPAAICCEEGEINRTGAISKCGDEMVRVMLYEAAQIIGAFGEVVLAQGLGPAG
jgi:hypothetical protein